jgi:hypothetical protein
VVAPNDLTNSTMWLKTLGGTPAGYYSDACVSVGPIMPQSISTPIPTAQLDLIKGWICSGAPAQ